MVGSFARWEKPRAYEMCEFFFIFTQIDSLFDLIRFVFVNRLLGIK